MSVDYYPCAICNESICDCGEFLYDDDIGYICTRCARKYLGDNYNDFQGVDYLTPEGKEKFKGLNLVQITQKEYDELLEYKFKYESVSK